MSLLEAVAIHRSLSEKRDAAYINLVQQINTRAASVIKNDMGSQSVSENTTTGTINGEHYFAHTKTLHKTHKTRKY